MHRRPPGFRHDMLVYRGEDEFLDGTLAFVGAAFRDAARVVAMVSGKRAEVLRAALGRDASRVRFADIEEIGRNPARLIPAWLDLLAADTADARSLRGIGEPVWADRDAAALDEAQRHEHLVNLAFADASDLWLLCPYDATALDAATMHEAHASHRSEQGPGGHPAGTDFFDVAFGGRLPRPPAVAETFVVRAERLSALRDFVGSYANDKGLSTTRVANLVLAVDEAASNSVLYGGGSGEAWIWDDGRNVVCEVRDRGRLSDPMTGRHPPQPQRPSRRGLWLANQLCDLVQIRSNDTGTAVRMTMGPD